MNKPSIITVNGGLLLGTIETTKDATKITDSLTLGAVVDVTKAHLKEFIKAKNIGKLNKPTIVTGQVTFTVADLSDDLSLEFDILLLKFEQAVKSAPALLVNAEFDKRA